MALTLAAYNDRIASLFESSNQFIFLDSEDRTLQDARRVSVQHNSIPELLHILNSNQATTLICGAISGPLFHLLTTNQIQVIPWITGKLDIVVAAYRNNELTSSSYLMPGCRRRGRRGFHGRRGRFQFN
ncbi:hypothetical protein JXB12_11530 [candidate division KSB1 bacterium]|nr:hypothetical protein [candidate division KSB1 bacterium]